MVGYPFLVALFISKGKLQGLKMDLKLYTVSVLLPNFCGTFAPTPSLLSLRVRWLYTGASPQKQLNQTKETYLSCGLFHSKM